MVVKCDKCKKPLIPTSFGYLHTIKSDCDEDDGVRVNEQTRYVFEKKYGKPKVLPEKKVRTQRKKILELTEDLESLTEICVGIMSENGELINEVEKCRKKLKKTKLKPIKTPPQKWKPKFLKKKFFKA